MNIEIEKERDIIIYQADINDEYIAEIIAADSEFEGDEYMRDFIEIYAELFEQKGYEVFKTGNHYIITESLVYIFYYYDEISDEKVAE